MRIEDVLRESVDPTDARTLMDAVRLEIEADSGVRLPDLRPAHTRDPRSPFQVIPSGDAPETVEGAAEAEAEEEPAGIHTHASPADDLDGDGLADMLIFEYEMPEETVQLHAVRGTNGSEIWAIEMSSVVDAIGWSIPDATGDGIGDFVLAGLTIHAESFEEDCPEDSFDYCRVDYAAEYTWLSGVLSGADGEVVWFRSTPGEETYHFLYENSQDTATGEIRYEERLSSTNISVFPSVIAEAGADATHDVVLESIDLDYDIAQNVDRTLVLAEDTGHFQVQSQTRAEVIDGSTGEVLLSRSSDPAATIAELFSAGQLVGDETEDLLWREVIYTPETYECLRVASLESCSDEREFAVGYSMEGIDGRSMETAWRTPLDNDLAIPVPLGADMTSDGSDDLAILTRDIEEDGVNPPEERLGLRMVSGRDGSSLWEREQAADAHFFEFPMVIDHYGGGAGEDLLTGSFLDDGAAGDVRLSRVDGATGQTLFESWPKIHAPETGQPDVVLTATYIFSSDDFDGDSGRDTITSGYRASFDCSAPPECSMTEVRSAAVADSGRTGSVVHAGEWPGEVTFLVPAADLDGDARVDAFEETVPLEQGEDYEIQARSLSAGSILWERVFSWDEYWGGTFWPGGDHDGEPGEEIVYGRSEVVGARWMSLVASLRGADATERWRIEKT